MRALRAAPVAGALALSTTSRPRPRRGRAFGRAYISTSVKNNGKRYERYRHTRLRVDFDHESGDRHLVGLASRM